MTHKLILNILILFLLTNCNSDTKKEQQETKSESRNFRNVNWNMTLDDVINNEDAKLAEKTNDYLAYDNINMFNTEFALMYLFKDNKLMASKYIAEVNPITGDAERLFENFKHTLSQKYGEPIFDQVNWSGMLEQLPKEKRKINDALLLNNVSLLTMWSDTSVKPRRSVRLECQKINKSIILINTNTDIEFQKELSSEEEEKLKKNL
jgi:hypothetical protein